jgi:SAM-dependent methyltransferase
VKGAGVDAYREDLAYVHESGHVALAKGAARALLDQLPLSHDSRGVVVDLGCGGGTLARILQDAGCSVLGVDLSAAMVEMARRQVPKASFVVQSVFDVDIPPCTAVTAIGEVFNYLFDERNDPDALADVLRRIHSALCPDGMLLFDVAGPDRAPPGPSESFVEHDDWAVFVRTSSADDVLTREITAFRRVDELYRRTQEEHRLRLIDPDWIASQLAATGFEVRPCARYADVPLPAGLHAYLARKPDNISA